MTNESYFDLSRSLEGTAPMRQRLRPAEGHALLKQALIDSIRHHYIADVPVGIFLRQD